MAADFAGTQSRAERRLHPGYRARYPNGPSRQARFDDCQPFGGSERRNTVEILGLGAHRDSGLPARQGGRFAARRMASTRTDAPEPKRRRTTIVASMRVDGSGSRAVPRPAGIRAASLQGNASAAQAPPASAAVPIRALSRADPLGLPRPVHASHPVLAL